MTVISVCPRCGAGVEGGVPSCWHCGMKQAPYQWLKRYSYLAWACLVALLIASVGVFHYHALYRSYQPARCDIINERITTYQLTSKKGTRTHYVAEFTYVVHAPDGSQERIVGYGGPISWLSSGLSDFTDESDAQRLLAQYQVGSTYDCWYSTIGPMHGVLALQDYADLDGIMTGITQILAIVASFIITVGLGRGVFLPWRLRKRGVSTTGYVVGHELRYTRSGAYNISVFAYRSPRESWYRTECRGAWWPIGSSQTVVYDPRHLQEAMVDLPSWKQIITRLIWLVLLLLVIMTVLVGIVIFA